MSKTNDNKNKSSYFESTVKTIIDADNMAKKIVAETEAQYSDVNAVVKERLSDYRDKQLKKMDKKIAEFKKTLEKKTADSHNDVTQESDKTLSKLKETYNSNKVKWEEEIFKTIVTP